MGRFAKTIKKSDDEREIKEILESQRFVDEILVLLKMLWSKEWKENVGITTEATADIEINASTTIQKIFVRFT